MKNQLYIDGIDIFESFGISVSEESYGDIAGFPALKPVPYNDWHEKDGIDPDLTSPVLDTKAITIAFHFAGSHANYAAFVDILSDEAYHLFNFIEIGCTKRLRLSKCGDIKSTLDLHGFKMTFIDDTPLEGYSYAAPQSAIYPLGDYCIDGVDVATYGLRVLQGTYDSIIKAPDVKLNLTTSNSISSGAKYDGEKVTYKSKSCKLRFLMKSASFEEFWRNRDALLFDLSKPGARVLSVAALDKDIPFYYKKCEVSCFFPDRGKIWFEFRVEIELFKGLI